MSWLVGVSQGFQEAQDKNREDERHRADQAYELQKNILTTLLQSPDEETQRFAFHELLGNATGPKRKRGLAGWVGEYQDSGAMGRLAAFAKTPKTPEGLPSRQLQSGIGPLVGAVPPQASTSLATARAGMPDSTAVQGGAPPDVTAAQLPSVGRYGPPPPPPDLTHGMEAPTAVPDRAPAEATIPTGTTGLPPPTPSTGGSGTGFGPLVAGPKATYHKLFDTPDEVNAREARKIGLEQDARRRADLDLLTSEYGDEEGRNIFATLYTGKTRAELRHGTPQQWVIPGPNGTFKHTMAGWDTKSNAYVDVRTGQPLPENAYPAGTGTRQGVVTGPRGEITKYDLDENTTFPLAGPGTGKVQYPPTARTNVVGTQFKGYDPESGTEKYYINKRDPNTGQVYSEEVVNAPAPVDDDPEVLQAQRALQMIDRSILDLYPMNQRFGTTKDQEIQAKRDEYARTYNYGSYAELQQKAAQSRRGGDNVRKDDPALPRGVRQYIARLRPKYDAQYKNTPGASKNAAAAELEQARASLYADHPDLDWGRVRQFLDELYGSAGAAPTKPTGVSPLPSGEPPEGPTAPGETAQAAPTGPMTVSITRAKLQEIATKRNAMNPTAPPITAAQLEAEVKARGWTVEQ